MRIFPSLTQNTFLQRWGIPLIIVLTLFISSLIVAITPPITGYELSIYGAYPISLWILISINIFFCIYMILMSYDDRSRKWVYGYFSILYLETIILLLPIFRGYYSMSRGGGDIYFHLYIANFISNSGYFPQTDLYPMMHILASILHFSLHDWISLALLLSIVFFILYVLYLYLLGKTLLGTSRGGIFVSIFAIPLIFSSTYYAFYPFLFALMLIPLIVFTYHKISTIQNRNGFYICLIFLSFFIVFCHPTITLFLIFIFLIFIFFEFLKQNTDTSRSLRSIAINVLVIIFIAFSFWFIHFRTLLNSAKNILDALSGQYGAQTIAEYEMNALTTTDASMWIIIDRFFKLYAPITFYFLFSFLFIFFIIKQYYKFNKKNENDFIYSCQFCGAILIGIAMTISYVIIFEPIRVASYGIFFATIICGFFIYRIWNLINSKNQKIKFALSVSVIITLICMLCIFNVYLSPWIGGLNRALTFEDKNGINWILEYRETEIPILREDTSMAKYSNYYYESQYKKLKYILEYPGIIPSHFGYDSMGSISEAFAYLPEKKVYMITTEMMKLIPYSVSFERQDRSKQFSNADFILLKDDPAVNLIYSNNEFGIWNIDI